MLCICGISLDNLNRLNKLTEWINLTETKLAKLTKFKLQMLSD